jgi:hypothetical protein
MAKEIKIYEKIAVTLRKKLKDERFLHSWRSEEDDYYQHEVSLKEVVSDKAKRKEIISSFEKFKDSKDEKLSKQSKLMLKRIAQYEMMMSQGSDAKINGLPDLKEVFEAEIKKAENRWVFSTEKDSSSVAFLFEKIEKRRGNQDEASHVRIKLIYWAHGEKKMERKSRTVNIFASDIDKGLTFSELMEKRNLSFGTKDLVAQYGEQMKNYADIHPQIGKQYHGANKCMVGNGNSYYWRTKWELLEVGGVKNKIIVDSSEDDSITASTDEGVQIPTHPYVKCYDITKHRPCYVHIDNMQEYIYDGSIKDKLVLPDDVSTLLDILIEQEGDLMEDIVKGKTGGIIVMATGKAGLGKTLTAEVYSEVMEKPLYTVQSSQLGINVKELEQSLENVLNRASRWNAILMIDEADTYIHERGKDVVQNCIVGVFLRLLEYYKGVLFMTSNRAEVVDDAIMSRCTAHIEYKHPERDDLIKIWEILSEQFKVKMEKNDILDIVNHYPSMGGRDVKNTVKLMGMVAKKNKEKCDLTMLNKLMPFMNFRAQMEK